ncbi:hypothetical protein PO124_30130 [Bacillus licheniformis]|nr:hypothetical protein [Bacillus licheniformis]
MYMTHHQRLKLAGIKPELIERVKEELGMPYCPPQQQRIAAVKTCPCGSPQIQTLAADLEKQQNPSSFRPRSPLGCRAVWTIACTLQFMTSDFSK